MLSRLEFDFEPLNKVLEGSEITEYDAYEVFSHSKHDSEKIFKVANDLRDHHKGKVVSFSKKAFFNIVLQVKAQSKNMMRHPNGLEKMDFHPLVNIWFTVLN